jgi:hypothetical protein
VGAARDRGQRCGGAAIAGTAAGKAGAAQVEPPAAAAEAVIMRRWLLLLLACSCQRDASTASRALPELGPAERAAIGDLDGDGRGEIVLAGAGRLAVLDGSGPQRAEVPAPGGIQVLVVGEVEGRAAVLAGWGRDRAHPDARARISLYRLAGNSLREEVIAEPDSERPQIAAIVPSPPDLLIAWYADKYLVKSAYARREGGSWRLDEVAAVRTAGSYTLGDVDGDGRRDLVVGRFYGDQLASDGEAFLLRPDGTRVVIPTTRGVNAIVLVGGDLFLADGWHKDYGKQARALLTLARWSGGAFRSEVIDELKGEYVIWRLIAADLDGDRTPELVARGSSSVRIYSQVEGRWRGRKVAGEAADIAAGDVDGRAGAEVLVVAPTGSRWVGGGR